MNVKSHSFYIYFMSLKTTFILWGKKVHSTICPSALYIWKLINIYPSYQFVLEKNFDQYSNVTTITNETLYKDIVIFDARFYGVQSSKKCLIQTMCWFYVWIAEIVVRFIIHRIAEKSFYSQGYVVQEGSYSPPHVAI